MSEYVVQHPTWPDTTRVADSAARRDEYLAAGWVLAPKDVTPTPSEPTLAELTDERE